MKLRSNKKPILEIHWRYLLGEKTGVTTHEGGYYEDCGEPSTYWWLDGSGTSTYNRAVCFDIDDELFYEDDEEPSNSSQMSYVVSAKGCKMLTGKKVATMPDEQGAQKEQIVITQIVDTETGKTLFEGESIGD